MDHQNLHHEIWNKIYEAIHNQVEALYTLNIQDETYEVLQASAFFSEYTPTKGSFEDLYRALFFQNNNEARQMEADYAVFMDLSIFHKNSAHGYFELNHNECERNFEFFVMTISNSLRILGITRLRDSVKNFSIEKQKFETIQEDYLFSMTINLKEDTCKSATATEISTENQDYSNLEYSQWRLMISNMFSQDDKNTFLTISDPQYLMDYLLENRRLQYEIQMMNMEGQFIWVRLSFSRIRGFSTDNPILVYTVQDIDKDMKRLLQQENIIAAVEEQNTKLEKANKAKNVFISNMSHEIRTPINAVLGMDEMILRESNDPNILSYANDIKNAGKMLLSIINDILDYSKIESGKMEIIPVEYSIKTMIKDIYNLLSIKIKEKQLGLNLEIDERLPEIVYGDEIRIKQVIINLLTNSVKYTEKGSVTFHIENVNQTDDEVFLLIRVTDTGIGMKQEEMGKLFSAFERLDEKRNRNVEGTGLGMSIVVNLLKQMNSQLEVESEYGKGSTFYFTLRQQLVDRTPIGKLDILSNNTTASPKQNARFLAPDAHILVIDDNKVNLSVVKGLLKRTKIQIDTAESGEICIEKIEKNHYDLILLDHLMPGMDGIETLEKIRAKGGIYQNIPVIALTANVMSGARERYINAGFLDFLEKPVSGNALEEMIFQYLPQDLIQTVLKE